MIGIINVQWFDNPGAVLLCYAMQKKISQLGYESEVINYTSGGNSLNHKSVLLRIVSKAKKYRILDGKIFNDLLKKRHKYYEQFRDEYINRTEPFSDIDDKYLKGYSTYIVGSDVVWKPEILLSKDSKIYFLDFVDSKVNTKISFAASVGTSDVKLLNDLRGQYVSKLKTFDLISVRESETANLFTKWLNMDVKTLIDPVFLLTGEEYANLIKNKYTEEEYIYFYMLAENKNAMSFCKKLSIKTGLKIYYDVHDNDNFKLRKYFSLIGKPTVDDGPSEFLERIYNAKYVVTNSFHGTAFSLLFHKDFFTFGCINNGIDVSLRMKNILNTINLLDRFEPDNCEKIDSQSINYDNVEEIISIERKKSVDFLKNALRRERIKENDGKK